MDRRLPEPGTKLRSARKDNGERGVVLSRVTGDGHLVVEMTHDKDGHEIPKVDRPVRRVLADRWRKSFKRSSPVDRVARAAAEAAEKAREAAAARAEAAAQREAEESARAQNAADDAYLAAHPEEWADNTVNQLEAISDEWAKQRPPDNPLPPEPVFPPDQLPPLPPDASRHDKLVRMALERGATPDMAREMADAFLASHAGQRVADEIMGTTLDTAATLDAEGRDLGLAPEQAEARTGEIIEQHYAPDSNVVDLASRRPTPEEDPPEPDPPGVRLFAAGEDEPLPDLGPERVSADLPPAAPDPLSDNPHADPSTDPEMYPPRHLAPVEEPSHDEIVDAVRQPDADPQMVADRWGDLTPDERRQTMAADYRELSEVEQRAKYGELAGRQLAQEREAARGLERERRPSEGQWWGDGPTPVAVAQRLPSPDDYASLPEPQAPAQGQAFSTGAEAVDRMPIPRNQAGDPRKGRAPGRTLRR